MMRISTLRRFLLAGSALIATATWTAASAQTIDDALAAAYRNSLSLASSRASLRAIDEGVPKALSGWRPTVTLAGSTGRAREVNRSTTTSTAAATNGVQSTSRNERVRQPDSASLTLSQPLYRGGRTTADVSKAENLVQRGRALLASAEQTVLVAAATAYADLQRDQATVDLNVNNEQVLTRQLEATRDRFQVGEVTRTDVAQAEARLEQARATRVQAEGNQTSSRATYERVVGVQAPARFSPARLPGNLPLNESEARSGGAEHPDVVATRFSEKAARDDVDLIAGEKLPTVSLNGTLERDHEARVRGVDQDFASVVLSVSVPLYQAGQTDARVREAKQTAGQRRIDAELQRTTSVENALKKLEALVTARARMASFESQIRSAEVALDGVEQEARVGLRTVLDVLNAEQELFSARVSLVGAQRDEVVAAYELTAAVGRLTAITLGLPVEIYDATRYYGETRERWSGTGVDGVDRSRPVSGADRDTR